MWLHMGSFGPMKVDASHPETIAGPPFRYGANPDTLLDITDLVFIDAPTTGLSRELGKAEPKDFFGVDKDLDAFTRTIQRYLTKYQRWNSPKFIIGESYGTTRAAGLVEFAARRGRPAQRHHVRLDRVQLRRFPGRPVADQLPADLRGRRLVPRQDRRQAAARGVPSAGARLRERSLCAGAAEGQRGQRRREAVGRAADGAADRPFAPTTSSARTCASIRTASGASCCATATRSSAESIRATSGPSRTTSAKAPITIRRASAITGAFVGALNDYLFRDLGYKTPLTYRPNNYAGIGGGNWNFQHKAPDGRSRSPTPASTSPTRCGRTRG